MALKFYGVSFQVYYCVNENCTDKTCPANNKTAHDFANVKLSLKLFDLVFRLLFNIVDFLL